MSEKMIFDSLAEGDDAKAKATTSFAKHCWGKSVWMKSGVLICLSFLMLFLGGVSAYAQVTGAVASYSFQEGAGTTTADSSGNNNTGTLSSGVSWTLGKIGNAVSFNGTSGNITVNDAPSLDFAGSFTLSGWIKPAALSGAQTILIKESTSGCAYFLQTVDNEIDSGFNNGSGCVEHRTTTANLTAGNWYHVASVLDRSTNTFKIYLNGNLILNASETQAPVSNTQPLVFGMSGCNACGNERWNGAIDEVQLYNRALSASDIQQLFNPGSPADTQPPTAPSGLRATAASSSQINLNWTPSTDNVGVSGYFVERCQGAACTNFVQIGTAAATTYNDGAGLLSNTPYSYQVRATDAAGNLSPYSNRTSATTATAPLTISPRTAALTFTRTQQFTASTTGLIWSVDGVAGGSASSGTITSTGLYAPPSSLGTHTVAATTSDQSQAANATVYITNYPGTFTHHNDNLRTGQNLNETVLTPANVNAATFGKLSTYQLDGVAYASPLYAANVNIPGQGFHNVVYVATEHDSVYAFDADGLSASPLWKVSFINPAAGITTVPPGDTGETGDIAPEIGITSTPVIDQSSGTIYVVAKTKESIGYVQKLHALDITTGAEKFSGPVVIQASVPGTGNGVQAGRIPYDPLRQNPRVALLLSNGVVYMAAGSHGDNSPWHGWVLGYNATTLQQVMAYNTTPNGNGAGVWHSGGGVAADSAGNLYFVTGNGDFDANTGGGDYGNSFMKLSPSGVVLDYFAPHDQSNLNFYDLDLGSAGVLLLPDQPGTAPHLVGNAGKSGTIFLVNRDNMGRFNSQNENQIVQSLVNIFPNPTFSNIGGNFSSPVYFSGFVFFSPVLDSIKAFQFSNGLLSTAPTSVSSTSYSYMGGALAISANNNTNGILWAVERLASYQNDLTARGVLHAYDATNLANELYNSSQAGSRDTLDFAAKYNIPLVANGKVFVANVSELVVYGLLP